MAKKKLSAKPMASPNGLSHHKGKASLKAPVGSTMEKDATTDEEVRKILPKRPVRISVKANPSKTAKRQKPVKRLTKDAIKLRYDCLGMALDFCNGSYPVFAADDFYNFIMGTLDVAALNKHDIKHDIKHDAGNDASVKKKERGRKEEVDSGSSMVTSVSGNGEEKAA